MNEEDLKVGDVIRFDNLVMAGGQDTHANVWAVIDREEDSEELAHFWMFHNVPEDWVPLEEPCDSFCADDKWVLVPPEDWPEEVCVALAKWRLTQ